jgi:hypothetical protein
MGLAPIAQAQDAIRPSLAGEAASEARAQDVSRIPYNLMLGPVRFRIGATVGVEYNDNVNYAEVGAQDDWIFTPALNLDAIWPITQLNTLRLDLGLAYAVYVDHSNYDTRGILIAPNSQIAFDFFVGDFRFNVHDRMLEQQDPVQEGALSNTANYGRFENTAGISLLWDLNKVLITLGYDHYNFVATTSAFDYLNRNAEELSGSAAYLLTPTIKVGVEANGVFNYYDQHVLNDSTDFTVGGFAETEITNNVKVRVAGGYQNIDFDQSFETLLVALPVFPFVALQTFRDHQQLTDWYANILLTHRLNSVITQSIAAGHESQLGVNSNYIKLNYIRHTVSWNIIRNTLLSTEFFYENAKESGGFVGEHFHRLGGPSPSATSSLLTSLWERVTNIPPRIPTCFCGITIKTALQSTPPIASSSTPGIKWG